MLNAARHYSFDIHLTTATGAQVGIDTAARYGYWERTNGSEGGGLWFEPMADGKLELTDYDGAAVLPQHYVDCLRLAGYEVGEEFNA